MPETALETHEEAADGFLVFSVVLLGVGSFGLMNGRVANVARLLTTAGTLAMVVAGYNVGHSGGALVYVHGAASAYTTVLNTRPTP